MASDPHLGPPPAGERLRLPAWFSVGVARLGPIGKIPFAPGTWGSLAGVGYVAMVCWPLGALYGTALAVVLAALAVPICTEAEVRLGRSDPGEIIFDEFAALPFCFLGWGQAGWAIGPTWTLLLAGFLGFRLFDIAKPLGIGRLQSLPRGWGVVADDLAAALLTCGLLHAGAWAWPRFMS